MRSLKFFVGICSLALFPVVGWGQDAGTNEKSAAEWEEVLEELLPIVVKNESYGMGRDRALSAYQVNGILQGGFRFYAREHRQMLDENLLPHLLKAALDRKRRWLLLGPMAAMYRLGRAKQLPALVGDDKAPPAQRVIAAAALYRAGESTPVETLIPLLRTAHELDLQQALVWLLGQSQEPAAVETVVGSLNHPRTELHEVAAYAVYYQKSPAAIAPLAERIRERHAAGDVAYRFILALGEIEDSKTAPMLAQLLAETLKTTKPNDPILNYLISAFEKVTDQSFRCEGQTHQECARKALAWWRQEEDKRIAR